MRGVATLTGAALVLVGLADLVLLNVAAITGQLGRPESFEPITSATWMAGVLSSALVLAAGLRLRKLDGAVVKLLLWGGLTCVLYVVLQRMGSGGATQGPTALGAVPRALLPFGALAVVGGLRSRGGSDPQGTEGEA